MALLKKQRAESMLNERIRKTGIKETAHQKTHQKAKVKNPKNPRKSNARISSRRNYSYNTKRELSGKKKENMENEQNAEEEKKTRNKRKNKE